MRQHSELFHRKPTQAQRLLDYLAQVGERGASSMDVIENLHIVNVTGRIDDIRKQGYTVICKRNLLGIFTFYLINQN
jgi:hypothetical protein